MRRAALLAVTLAAVMAAACSSGPNDQAVATEIKAKFFSDAQLKAANLTVTSKDGVVTLAGEVPSDGARYQAFKYATDTKGVAKVEDHMTVTMAQAASLAPPVHEAKPAPPARPAKTVLTHSKSNTSWKEPKPAPPSVSEQTLPPPPPAPAAQPAQQAPPPPPEPPKPIEAEIPAGTELVVRLIDPIDTEVNRTGERFRASIDVPIQIDGHTVVPAGTDATVELMEAKSAGRMASSSEVKLQVVKFELQGQTYSITTNTHDQKGAGEGKNTATKVGVGAAAGAIIGAIAGGGKGAAIGATVGAGGGAGVSAAKKGEQIKLPSETRLTFTLQAPVPVTYLPETNKRRRNS